MKRVLGLVLAGLVGAGTLFSGVGVAHADDGKGGGVFDNINEQIQEGNKNIEVAEPVLDKNMAVDINDHNFPDEAFREFVKQYDLNKNEKLESNERGAVTNMDCSNLNITSLDGIGWFYNLETLNFDMNDVYEVNLSNNDKLKEVSGEYNHTKKKI